MPSRSCPVCRHRDRYLFRELPSSVGPGTCRFLRCEGCGSLQDVTSPPLDYREEESVDLLALEPMVRFYFELAGPLRPMAALLDLLLPGEGDPVGEAGPDPPGAASSPVRLLDVGAHLGLGGAMARAQGYPVLGLEPGGVRRAACHLFDLELRSGRLEDQSPEIGLFDRILASEVLEHVPDPRSFLARLANLLEPGGRLLLSTPDAACLSREPGPLDGLFCPGQHRVLFTREGLATLLREVGLEGQRFLPTRPGAGSLVFLAARRDEELPARIRVEPTRVRRRLERFCEQELRRLESPGDPLLRSLAQALTGTLLQLALEEGRQRRAAELVGGLLGSLPLEQRGDPSPELVDNLEAERGPEAYLEAHPGGLAEWLLARSQIELETGGDPARALKDLTAALAHAGCLEALGIASSRVLVARARLYLGVAALRARDPKAALGHLEALSDEESSSLLGRAEGSRRLYRGAALWRLGRYRGAVRGWARALTGGLLPLPLGLTPWIRRLRVRLG